MSGVPSFVAASSFSSTCQANPRSVIFISSGVAVLYDVPIISISLI